MFPSEKEKIYVVHALTGYEHHEHWVRNLFKEYQLDFEFMTDGDPSFFTEDLLSKFFIPEMRTLYQDGKISVTLNHLLCYEKMISDNCDIALIFEDDPCFLPNFSSYLEKFVLEFKQNSEPAIVSIENSTLRFPSWRTIKKGQYLYPENSGRAAGAYMINLEGAKSILKSLDTKKCTTIIDWWHNELIEQDIIKMYWAHPPIVEQGSHNGKMQAINSIRSKGLWRRISWSAEKFYKMYILRWFR